MPENHSTDSDDHAARAHRAAEYLALAERLRKLGAECSFDQTKASLFALAVSYDSLAARLSESDRNR
jgi:hypothetical protein